jgi:hypothetical protein
MRKKQHRGIDAIVSIPLKFLHPSEYIRETFPNRISNQKLENCRILQQEQILICRQQHLAVVVSHELFPNKELYCVERYAKVTKEGPPDSFLIKMKKVSRFMSKKE